MATAIDFATRLPQLAYTSVPRLLRQYVLPQVPPRPPRGPGPIPEPPPARPDWPALLREQRPMVLTEEVVRWPASERWTPAYLREALGAKRVPVLVSSAESRDFGLAFWYQKQVELRIDELIDLTFGGGAASDTRYYMWGGGGWSVLGALADDVPIPKQIDGRPRHARLRHLRASSRSSSRPSVTSSCCAPARCSSSRPTDGTRSSRSTTTCRCPAGTRSTGPSSCIRARSRRS